MKSLQIAKGLNQKVQIYFNYKKRIGKIEEEYLKVLKSGMFWEFHPELSGDYDQDKDEWKRIYYKLQKIRKKNGH